MDPIPVLLPVAGVELAGDLVLPGPRRGLVLFAHGSGSSRFSSRNRFVAAVLQRAGLATLLFDLLTAEEERRDRVDAALRFDIPLLSERLIGAIDWTAAQPQLSGLPLGLFGASTGAAAALIAAAERPAGVHAVVSRGGRPDLAMAALPQVRCPTLLIVGGRDPEVLQLNRQAAAALRAPQALELVPGASHLFEEPGTLAAASRLACDWFLEHLPGGDGGCDPGAAVR
ncbi:dienelactone hydrolase family protein [Cyanobium sp. CH-040]|uniref:dienelactone hydrolase family protein n=1 Tax=Cyanobium sp. CH-040 TaxID=2823708 RepID=UPI0020CEEF07|nr:alpha/beta family hydrolase [Cyanobium sp. CH-040]MCP9927461.1 dienelactone hydrolase family protein [Cyanobium sp. CH-040]